MKPIAADSWLRLFVAARVVAVLVAVGLLVVHRVTPYDLVLAGSIVVYGASSLAAAVRTPAALRSPVLWFVDIGISLGFVLVSGDWRSPFYLFALTALAPPSAALPFRRALAVGGAFTVAFIVVALLTGLDLGTLRSSIRLETFATHLALPGAVTLGLAYAAEVLRRLERERERSGRLAVEAERRRIAWELHDSAKQRLHAAHLVLSSLPSCETVDAGLEQLRGAAADMDTSIAELGSPLGGRRLEVALSERAAELDDLTGGTEVCIHGTAPPLPAATAAHAYRILSEAMTNAVQHAGASKIDVHLVTEANALLARVEDDGRGLPETLRPGANGLRTMSSRAFALGAQLSIESGPHARGTCVRLSVPPTSPEGARS